MPLKTQVFKLYTSTCNFKQNIAHKRVKPKTCVFTAIKMNPKTLIYKSKWGGRQSCIMNLFFFRFPGWTLIFPHMVCTNEIFYYL